MVEIPQNQRFWNDVLKKVTRRIRNDADAEDLLHDAFLRLEQYCVDHPVSNPAAFLVRTAVNIKIDNYRHEKFAAEYHHDIALNIQDHGPLQDEVVGARARLERVRAGIDQLTPRTRQVFLMHRLEGLKHSEIAQKLGISKSGVEKHIAKAVLLLSDWMEGW